MTEAIEISIDEEREIEKERFTNQENRVERKKIEKWERKDEGDANEVTNTNDDFFKAWRKEEWAVQNEGR